MSGSLLSSHAKAGYLNDEIWSVTAGIQRPSGRPKAIIVAGQPGSGKSRFSKKAVELAAPNGGAVLIDVDETRATHPLYEDLARQDEMTAADKTHQDASEVSDLTRKVVMQRGLNVVIDGTLKSPENAKQLVRDLVEAGYDVEVIALSVPSAESWAGCKTRFWELKRKIGYGRWVPKSVHDAAVAGLPKSLLALQQQGLVSKIQVVERDGTIVSETSPKSQNGGAVAGPASEVRSNVSAGNGRPVARVADVTMHGTPLSPGPGSPNVFIGGMPAWRGLPAGAGAALQSAQAAAGATVKTAEAATLAAAGTPGAPAAYAAEQATKASTAAAMASMMSSLAASAVTPSGGAPDTHICPVPAPVPPHGPGYVVDGSSTVLVNGLPLCRQGDTVVEALGGPDKIAVGLPTVLVGG